MDQQKAAQFRARQIMLEDYKRYLTQEITAQAEHTRRAIALGDALLRAEKQQAAEAARARREAVASEGRQQRDEGYFVRSQQLSGRTDARAGERQGGARERLAGGVGTGLMVGGGAILAGLAVATEQFSRFDAKLVEVRNNTQMTDAEFDAMKAHILQTGQATGASMEQMAQAFMRAKNHAFDLKESLSIVDAATKSALATGSDIGETANVLSQTMHIFRLSGDQAAEAMNTLHMASLQGNTTMTELVQNFGLAEAVTSKYGLTLQDTSAVFATMTENGLNAAEAGTQIRDVMQHLVAPGKAAREEIARLSKTFPALGEDIEALRNGNGSLTKTMIDLSAATGGQAQEINKIIPAQRGAFGAMALSGKAADDLRRNYDQLVLTMSGKLDPTTDGFLRQQKTLSAQTARLNIDVQAIENTIGKALTPTVRDAADALGGMARQFNALSPETQRAIILGTTLVGVLALVGGGALSAASKIASLMADLKTAGVAFGGMATAAEGAGAAEVAAGTVGATTFAVGGAWALAIGAAIVLVLSLRHAWEEVKAAQHFSWADDLKNGIGSRAGDLAARDKAYQEIAQGQQHSGDGDLAVQSAKNRAEAQRILSSPEYTSAKTQVGSSEAEIKRIRAGGVGAYTGHGESTSAALSEYNHALKTQTENLKEAKAALSGYERDAHNLRADAGKMSGGNALTDAMAKHIGQATGVECGAAVTKALRERGLSGTATSLAQAAAADKSRQLRPDTEGHFPPGTIFFFPGKSGMKNIGSDPSEHFGMAGAISERGRQNVLESTTAGGQGRHYRGDRTFGHIAQQHGGYIAFAPGGDPGPARKSGAPPPAEENDKAATDRAQALVEAAGLDVDKASAAFEHCKNEYARTGDGHFLVLAKTARMKLRQAQIARAQAALAKEVAKAHKDSTSALAAKEQFKAAKFSADNSYTSDIQGLGDQINGTPKDKANTAFDVAIGRKEAQLAAVKSQIGHYSRALDKGNDPQVADALANAYRREKTLTDQKAGIEYKKGVFGNKNDDGVLAQKESLTTTEAQRTLDQNLLTLAQKRLEAFTRILDVQKEQRQEARRLLDAHLAAPGVTDAQKADLRGKKYRLDLADIGDEYTRDQASPSKPTRQAAKPKFESAVATLNTEYTGGTTENANEALRRHADLLHTQADATDELNQKMLLLTQYFDTLAKVAGQTPEQAAALGIERKTTLTDLQRGITSRDGQLQIGAGLQNKDQGSVELGLQILGINATTGTRTQQAAGRGEYLDTVKGLGVSGALPADDALLRVQGIRQAAETPAEIAAATDAARQILDRLLAKKGRDIALLKNPEDRRKALQAEIAQVQKNPDVPGEVKHDAVAGLQGQLDSGRNRDKLSVGGEEFWKGMAADAGREGGDIVRAMLNPRDKRNIGKQFWGWLSQTGENALGGVVSSSIQNALTGGMKGMNGKNLFGDLEGLFKGAKGSMLEGAAGIYGAAMALGAGGKKKQKHSIFGAVLGGIAGSFFGQAGTGAELGSALGGMFAEGGRPPLGKYSIIGERGPELWKPDGAGTIIPNHGIAAFMRQAMAPQARMPSGMYGGARAGVSPQGTTTARTGQTSGSVSAEMNFYGDSHYHYAEDAEKQNRRMAKSLEDALRSGIPA